MIGRIKAALPALLVKFNKLSQRFGVTVLPNHFYSEIPDFNELARTTGWRKPMSMHGIDSAAEATQLATLASWIAAGKAAGDVVGVHDRACEANGEGGFGPMEAQALYAFVAREKPAKIVQVGCGVSTAIILEAARDVGYKPELVCVEPYPTDVLKRFASEGKLTLHSAKAQDVPSDELAAMADGGFLFVDSTHTLRPGSEVIVLVSEILPRLSAGTWAHFHDIYFPYDYGPALLDEGVFQFRENTLLYSYLVDNARWRIEVCMSMLHHMQREGLAGTLTGYEPMPMTEGLRAGEGHFPASIYIRAVGEPI
ncbi:MAG: class I SAM-dependent methyltransferase [Phycisphaera sp.]|nr:MAG: class I SAM-dependent methyltransferase [Phycisphaera sp.]